MEGKTGLGPRAGDCERCGCHISSFAGCAPRHAAGPVYLACIACGRSGCIRSLARTGELVGGLPIIDLYYCVDCRTAATEPHSPHVFVMNFFSSFPPHSARFLFRRKLHEKTSRWKICFHLWHRSLDTLRVFLVQANTRCLMNVTMSGT